MPSFQQCTVMQEDKGKLKLCRRVHELQSGKI